MSELRRDAAATLLASFPGDRVPAWFARRVEDGLGGVCLYGSNRQADLAGVADRLHDLRLDTLVALDEEGGDVTRLEARTGSSVPGNAALGAIDDVDLTRAVASALGRVLAGAGVDLDLAPCADVNTDPANPVIGVRSFGRDPDLVARHTVAFVDGLQSAGVAACAKHFPGHGAVRVDSHLGLPTLDAGPATLRSRELVPFRAAVQAGCAAVMSAHLRVPAVDGVPATVSRRFLTDVLRSELGFAGVVVTDALDMAGIGGPEEIPANVVRAVAAGADLCCLGPDGTDELLQACIDALVDAVACDRLDPSRLQEAAARVGSLRRTPAPTLAGPAGVASSSSPAPLDALAEVGAEAARRALRVDGDLAESYRGAHVIELDRPANIAAGFVPWGVGATLSAGDAQATVERLTETADRHALDRALASAAARPLVVVVRDPQRRPAQAALLQAVVAARPDALVVDMGWPAEHPPAAAARVCTFGASRASGEAAAALLLGDRRAPTLLSRRTSRG
jgi:beta-N-acetylhexosaminidase